MSENYQKYPWDLVICARDRNFYRLTTDAYTSDAFKIRRTDNPEFSGLMALFANGSTFGSVPKNVGTACYMVSLASLRLDNPAYTNSIVPLSSAPGETRSRPEPPSVLRDQNQDPEDLIVFSAAKEVEGAMYHLKASFYKREEFLVPAMHESNIVDALTHGIVFVGWPSREASNVTSLRYGLNLAIVDLPHEKLM